MLRHQPPQRAVLGQFDCFVQCKVVGSQLSLDGVQPRDAGTSWWSLPVLWRGSRLATYKHMASLGYALYRVPSSMPFFWRKTTPEYVTVWLCSCETVAGVTASSGIVNSTDTWWLGELCEYVSCCHGELTRRRRPATSPADLPVDVHCLHAGD